MHSSFDAVAYDAERLRLDEQALKGMRSQMSSDVAAEEKLPGSKEGAWKWEMRKKMWDYMEENDIARFPRPVHHRIPNFDGADVAANRLVGLPEFEAAQCVKVNPDTPQKQVRYRALSSGKRLLVPQPRLRTGFFSELHITTLPQGALGQACTSAGVAKYGKPLDLFSELKVDLVVVGSSCVSRNGARLGKGEGFAELEYGMLRWMGAIDEHTLIVTTVHDCQVLEVDIPAERLLEHDVPVDIIVTPTKVIHTNTTIPKPSGILWHKLSPEKLAQIRILQQLKEHIEMETGERLPSGPHETLPPTAARQQNRGQQSRGSSKRSGKPKQPTAQGKTG